MKVLFAAFLFAVALGGAPADLPIQSPCQEASCHELADHSLARSNSYRAVCSKGDLNAVYSSRGDAAKAAQAHQKSTGHQTSVSKI